ncbi:WecB/TagA/CpsF family glycosyltransferase [Actinopolymorpha alba]|uniref:WecB/TagA/CpsF family glycosyltransferase n=1 Tax=Actinopolymorpha alba TaxID=533267 RepID=UPI00036E1889|nr:WecB/TagA/CpsF family glycosyltransferase [Actinopolymorpha alba]
MTTPRQTRADDHTVATDWVESRRARICGVPVHVLTMEESVEAACELIQTGEPHQHVAINAAKVVAARRDPVLRDIIESCTIANADGQSVVWASRLLGPRLPERVAGIDFMLRMWEVSARKGYRVYLLGAKPATVLKAAEAARTQGVDIVGARSGYWKPEEEQDVVAEVARTRPDLLFVGLPTPRKEKFLHRHLSTLRTPLAVGVGGSFDVVAGEVSRAPLWMQKWGLEWVHRMRQEPRRLLRRYVLGNVEFVALVLREAFAKLRRSSSS